MNSDDDMITDIVLGFLTAMRDWELQAFRDYERIESRGFPDKARREFVDKNDAKATTVLARFCSRRESAARERPIGSPPEYDPSLEVIVDVKHRGSKAYVYTERSEEAVFPGKVMYVLVREKGQWKIDQKKLWNGKRYEHAEI